MSLNIIHTNILLLCNEIVMYRGIRVFLISYKAVLTCTHHKGLSKSIKMLFLAKIIYFNS